MIPVTLKYMILADYDKYIKALVACWSELTYKFTTGVGGQQATLLKLDEIN